MLSHSSDKDYNLLLVIKIISINATNTIAKARSSFFIVGFFLLLQKTYNYQHYN